MSPISLYILSFGGQFYDALHSVLQPVGVLAASCSKMGLTAATSLDETGSLAHDLSGIVSLAHCGLL